MSNVAKSPLTVVLGTEGQVAQAFKKIALQRKLNYLFLKRSEIDFSDSQKVISELNVLKPKFVINAAAYTAVDKSETEKELALQINAHTPTALAKWCFENQSTLVHYSTDYVFDGTGTNPHLESEKTHPVNYYGFTKEQGEIGIQKSGCSYLIFRISWVYYEQGNNFVKTMLRFGSQKEEMSVVNDQVGYPTYAGDVAESTIKALEYYFSDRNKLSSDNNFVNGPKEIFHMSSHTHTTTWYDFAQQIFTNARELGFPLQIKKLNPILSSQFPTPAQRPLNSRMNSSSIKEKLNITMPDWRQSLLKCMKHLKPTVQSAVILAGGKGTRLGVETTSLPKPMIEIAGKPLLQWQIEMLKEQGISKIYLLTGHLSQVIEDYFKDGSQFGVQLNYIIESEPLGTAGALAQLESKLHEPFYIIYGDLFLKLDLHRISLFKEQTNAMGVLVVHPNDHPYDSDLVEVDSSMKVINLLSKDRSKNQFYKNVVNAAVYLFDPLIFKFLKNSKGKDLARDIFPELIKHEAVFAYSTPEYLKDMGTPERLAKVRNDVEIGKPNKWCLTTPRPVAFLDRDGVICKHVPFLSDINDFELNPGVPKAIRLLNQAGYLVVVVTNQPMVAMGKLSENDLHKIHNKMESLLGDEGAWVDHIFYCPHHPDAGFDNERFELKIKCNCRKPAIGMFVQATLKFNVDRKKSLMFGDSWRDMQAGSHFGLKTYGIHGVEGFTDKKTGIEYNPQVECSSLLEAVELLNANFKV